MWANTFTFVFTIVRNIHIYKYSTPLMTKFWHFDTFSLSNHNFFCNEEKTSLSSHCPLVTQFWSSQNSLMYLKYSEFTFVLCKYLLNSYFKSFKVRKLNGEEIECINFCANNYLGLAGHPDVVEGTRNSWNTVTLYGAWLTTQVHMNNHAICFIFLWKRLWWYMTH